MKKILVPYDFSKTAAHAYRFALDVAARAKGATVHILHVIELPVMHDSVLMPVLDFETQLLKELREKAEKQLTAMVDKHPHEDVKVVQHVHFGAVLKSIREYAHEQAIDLIVAGSHGASGVRELFIGSNAEKIVRFSSVPVLIVKEYYKGAIKNIVFPNTLDTEGQDELVKRVKALQRFFHADLHIVWINTPYNFASDTETYARLHDFVKKYGIRNYTVHVFNHNDEEQGILEFARTVGGNLIAMGTRGRKGVAHFFNGSVAEDVVNHSSHPVWTYSPQEAESA
ncbi:universal stress protein [Dawidia soli]|uniref:Universal stress protein n=1 Tax=Dawidia soli TaxID=2782352 RepID=A0AAP2D8U7_9BACT|nr:universal stress protein [Dawidia soli]MBT1686470.1 universal stress protein [Dawidia soli]